MDSNVIHSSGNSPDWPAERPGSGKGATASSLQAPTFSAPLTVIKGNAQLIRRRSRGLDEHDAAALEQSVVAIELAVQRILVALAAAMATSTRESGDKPGERN